MTPDRSNGPNHHRAGAASKQRRTSPGKELPVSTGPAMLRTCLAAVAATSVMITAAVADDAQPPKQKMLFEIFSPIMQETGVLP